MNSLSGNSKTKQFLICPVCEANGKKEVLAEIGDDGSLMIMRFHNSFTKVVGTNMAVICNTCGEKVYFKQYEEPAKVSNNWGPTQWREISYQEMRSISDRLQEGL